MRYSELYKKALLDDVIPFWENNSLDRENGEWFGYLKREGKPLLALKEGKWKGCFHVPRAMYQCWKSFEKIEVRIKNGFYPYP